MLRRDLSFEKKYEQLLTEIRQGIETGDLREGDYILPENTMSEKYQLSRFSVRKALAKLVEEDLIEKVPGIGNRVKRSGHADRGKSAAVETIRLGWFEHAFELPAVRQMIRSFEARHPQIKVELQLFPEEGYFGWLLQTLGTEGCPDLFHLADAQLNRICDDGKLPLLLPIEPEPQVRHDWYDGVRGMFDIEGKLRASPFAFSPIVLICNERIWSEAGLAGKVGIESWSDLVETAKACTVYDETGGIKQYGLCFTTGAHRWQGFVLQNGGGLVSEDGKRSTFTHPATLEAIRFCRDLIHEHRIFPAVPDGRVSEKVFAEGKAAMILSSYYFMNMFHSLSDEWRVMPAFGEKRKATLLMGSGIAVHAQAKHPEAAARFARFLGQPEAQTLLKRNSCTIPVLRSVAEDASLLDERIHPRNYEMFRDILPYARSFREMRLTTPLLNVAREELVFAWTGIKRPQEVCEAIDRALNGE